MNREIKSRKTMKNSKNALKEMEEQKSYGFTKILCCACGSKLKKRYLKSFDGSIIILLLRQLGVLSYFGWANPSDGIIKS